MDNLFSILNKSWNELSVEELEIVKKEFDSQEAYETYRGFVKTVESSPVQGEFKPDFQKLSAAVKPNNNRGITKVLMLTPLLFPKIAAASVLVFAVLSTNLDMNNSIDQTGVDSLAVYQESPTLLDSLFVDTTQLH